ncbi:L,D-transpeptidase family protein [Marinifilum sp.]|uniref:L,D-transpeptidase family protein n=1 Tax=Marinifilum sp. TaxID=2033137 RepID=UPI003BA8A322
MKLILAIILTSLALNNPSSFKFLQLKYPRVRNAYAEKEQGMLKILESKNIKTNQLEVYLRAFKFGQKIQLWGKNKSDTKFKLLKEYKVCRKSGKLGPKRKQGDLQVPEGFYYIDRFNPASNFHLSLGINYPNKSDLVFADKSHPGGDIFIHGACVTVGCLPITDDKIKELYIFCVEAKNNGQNKIPVHIFPVKLSDKNLKILLSKYRNDTDKVNLWKALKLAYDGFNHSKQVPKIKFLSNGRHQFEALKSN